MQIKNLKPNKRNPRKISAKKLDALKKSVAKFGDLSGFVFNRRTGQLISGHQRSKTIPQDSTIKIEVKHEKPTAAHTVAEGYVEVNGERFKYREVDAPESWEVEAMIAANKHGGEWDTDILRLTFADFPEMDIESTGFDLGELAEMNIDISLDVPEVEIRGSDEESDEEYLANHEGPEDSISKENIDTTNYSNDPEVEEPEPGEVTNPFAEVDETTEPAGRRIVLIIDCTSDDQKKEIKGLIKDVVEGAGGKFF